MAGLLGWVRRALGRVHLVEVAAALHRDLGLDVAGLRQLRLPVDLLADFPDWRRRSTGGFHARPLGLTLVPGGAGHALGTIRLQVSTAWGGTALTLGLAADLLRRLDPAVRVVVLMDPGTDAAGVRRLARESLGRQPRLRLVGVDSGTIFARDNALAARDARGRPVLLVPRTLRTDWDPDATPLAAAAARRHLGLRVARSRLYWHGGNVLFDGETLAVGADLITENVSRLGLTAGEVLRVLGAELGREVVVLGTLRGRFDHARNRVEPSGQASYHVDLDVALLGRVGAGRPVALVADPRGGLALLPRVLAHGRLTRSEHLPPGRARAQLAREYRAAARERAPRLRDYRARLAGLGYRIVGVPELRTRPRRETVLALSTRDLAGCNVLPGLNRGRPAVHYLPWGLPALDAAAGRSLRAAGVRPVRISRTAALAAAMMERAAGLRCFCGVMP